MESSEKSSASKKSHDKGKLVDEEERGKGDVKLAVYWLYIKQQVVFVYF